MKTWLTLIGVGALVLSGCASQTDDGASGGANSAAVTIGQTGWWCTHFNVCSDDLQTTDLLFNKMPGSDPSTFGWACADRAPGLHVRLLVPDSDAVELGVSDASGHVQFTAAPGTYNFAVSDGSEDVALYAQRSSDVVTQLTVVGTDPAGFAVNFNVLYTSDPTRYECSSCAALTAGTTPACDTNYVYRYCDGQGTVMELDCAANGQYCQDGIPGCLTPTPSSDGSGGGT